MRCAALAASVLVVALSAFTAVATAEELTTSRSKIESLRVQIQRCWNVPDGAFDAKITVHMRLDKSGVIDGNLEVVSGGGKPGSIEHAASQAALRAIVQCSPYTLPAERYEAWSDVLVHFDPSDMWLLAK